MQRNIGRQAQGKPGRQCRMARAPPNPMRRTCTTKVARPHCAAIDGSGARTRRRLSRAARRTIAKSAPAEQSGNLSGIADVNRAPATCA